MKSFFVAVALFGFCGSSTLAQQSSKPAKPDNRPISDNRSNLGNDSCDKKVRAKYPSGTMRTDSRLRLVEACRQGKPW